MEYKLNRIDTDRRKQINDAVKEGLVHGYDSISIYKDEERKKETEKKLKPQKYMLTKLFIDATKAEQLEIEAYKEEVDIDKNHKGNFVDIKK